MSKMKMPEMDVVRFQESDVIVASGNILLDSITLNNFGDGKNNNASITAGGVTYGGQQGGDNTFEKAFSIYSNLDNKTEFRHDGGQTYFSSVYNLDTDGSVNEHVDGVYIWKDTFFEHQ